MLLPIFNSVSMNECTVCLGCITCTFTPVLVSLLTAVIFEPQP